MWSFVSGVVGLSLFELLVSSSSTTGGAARVGGLANIPSAVARWFIDPSVPGLPAPKSAKVPGATTTAPKSAVVPKARAAGAHKTSTKPLST